jgi:hypothetical protein
MDIAHRLALSRRGQSFPWLDNTRCAVSHKTVEFEAVEFAIRNPTDAKLLVRYRWIAASIDIGVAEADRPASNERGKTARLRPRSFFLASARVLLRPEHSSLPQPRQLIRKGLIPFGVRFKRAARKYIVLPRRVAEAALDHHPARQFESLEIGGQRVRITGADHAGSMRAC